MKSISARSTKPNRPTPFKKYSLYTLLFLAMVMILVGIAKLALPLYSSLNFTRQKTFLFQQALEETLPVRQDRHFVAIIIADPKKPPTLNRSFDSLFHQTYSNYELIYVDNGGDIPTFNRTKQWLEDQSPHCPVQTIHHHQPKPKLEILYEMIHTLPVESIILPIEAGDWLAHHHVFDKLNHIYANPNVWMTYSRAMSDPDYRSVIGTLHADSTFIDKKIRHKKNLSLEGLKSFYAGFFHTIHLKDCLVNQTFIDHCAQLAIDLPLVEMGPEHIYFVDQVCYIHRPYKHRPRSRGHHAQKKNIEAAIRKKPIYATLHQWRPFDATKTTHDRLCSDIIVFSHNRPLELGATLESIFDNITNINHIFVIYQATNPLFERAYLNLEKSFPTTEFFPVCDDPTATFHALLQQTLFSTAISSPYVMFLDDNLALTHPFSLGRCIAALEKVHVRSLFVPAYSPVDHRPTEAIYAVDEEIIAQKSDDLSLALEKGVVICHKGLFKTNLHRPITKVRDLNDHLDHLIHREQVTLCFTKPKASAALAVRPISEQDAHTQAYQLINGFKIDLQSLVVEAPTQPTDEYPLIKRQPGQKKFHTSPLSS